MKLYRGEKSEVSNNNTWFKERFPNGKYRDIDGLCKIVTLEELKVNDYSLNPGRYVGVTATLEENFDFKIRLAQIQEEMDILNSEAAKFSQTIANNLKSLI